MAAIRRDHFQSAARDYIAWITDKRGLSANTVRTYESSLVMAARLLPEETDEAGLLTALEPRLGPGATAHVRRTTYVVLDLFFRWWEREGGPPNPLAEMEPVRRSRARRRGLTASELEILMPRLEAAPPKDRAEVALMLCNGFRTGDVAILKVEDLDFEGRRIRCRSGKGGTDVWLPLSDLAGAALRKHLHASGIDSGWCFTGPNGHIGTRGIFKAWKRVAGAAIDLPAHSLRHSFATALARDTDINTVRRMMRHESLATTQLYLDDDPDSERAAMDDVDQKLQGIGRSAGPGPWTTPPPPLDRPDQEVVYQEMVARLSPYLDCYTNFTTGFATTVRGWFALAETLRDYLDQHPEERDAPRPGPLVYEPEDAPPVVIRGHTYGLLLRFAETAPPLHQTKIPPSPTGAPEPPIQAGPTSPVQQPVAAEEAPGFSTDEVSLEEFAAGLSDCDPLLFSIRGLPPQRDWECLAAWLTRQFGRHPENRDDLVRLVKCDVHARRGVRVAEADERWAPPSDGGYVGWLRRIRPDVGTVTRPLTKKQLHSFAIGLSGDVPPTGGMGSGRSRPALYIVR
jgi:integrase